LQGLQRRPFRADQPATAPLKNAFTNALIKQFTFGYDSASESHVGNGGTTTTTSTPNNVNAITTKAAG
jgi:hypothetical protein